MNLNLNNLETAKDILIKDDGTENPCQCMFADSLQGTGQNTKESVEENNSSEGEPGMDNRISESEKDDNRLLLEFIADLLSTDGSHGQGDIYLSEFMKNKNLFTLAENLRNLDRLNEFIEDVRLLNEFKNAMTDSTILKHTGTEVTVKNAAGASYSVDILVEAASETGGKYGLILQKEPSDRDSIEKILKFYDGVQTVNEWAEQRFGENNYNIILVSDDMGSSANFYNYPLKRISLDELQAWILSCAEITKGSDLSHGYKSIRNDLLKNRIRKVAWHIKKELLRHI